ncbi:MAG: hypothetical protein IKQ39_02665 [Oscillospiraceae bacterium]|nr:hypothetical protein [Oscillospiraceae bacterium]
MKFKCPHCGKETFSPWRKMRCGGMTSYGKPCLECGRRCVNGKTALIANTVLSVMGLVAILYCYFTFRSYRDVFLTGVIPFAATIIMRILFNMFVGDLVPALKTRK